MVGAEDIGMDRGLLKLREECVRNKKVVDAPPNVTLARSSAIAPPGIDVGLVRI